MARYLIFLFILPLHILGQSDIRNFTGGWAGELPTVGQFQYSLNLSENNEGNYYLKVIGKEAQYQVELTPYQEGFLRGMIGGKIPIKLDLRAEQPVGFIQTGHHLSFLDFKEEHDTWTAHWNLLLSESFDPTFYLSLDQYEDSTFGASTFFQAPVCHYMFGQNFQLQDPNLFTFTDIRSGLEFTGRMENSGKIILEMRFLEESVEFDLSPLDYEKWNVHGTDSAIPPVGNNQLSFSKKLAPMVEDILSDSLEGTHSVIVIQKGEKVFEHYFDGFSPEVIHDTRSLSKSFAGAITGIAIADGFLENEHQTIQKFLADAYPGTDWSEGKDKIELHHLLTMSSGMDLIDFGLDRRSFASEGAYQSQENWTRHILSASMAYPTGEEAWYGSGNPHLLGPVLSSVLKEDLAFYLHRKLFGPLGITDYRIQTDSEDQPYFGGGWYFRPEDLTRFGSLYIHDGKWEGTQIIPKEWVKKSVLKHSVLENTRNKNRYGYLLWHQTYTIGSQEIASVEGRGSGGQYLFMIPEFDLIAVITSGNYRNGKTSQPEKIMKDYILKSLLEK